MHISTKRGPWRVWTEEELAALRELAAEGLPPAAIGYQMRARYGRSAKATKNKIIELGGVDALRGERTFFQHSLGGVCRLMGEDISTVSTWVQRGWLEATRYRRRRKAERTSGPMYLVADTALHAFLSVEAAWPSYNPAQIADPDLRAEAERLRAEAGGGWVKGVDLMRELCYCAHDAARMIHGYPGEKRTLMWKSAIYLWAPHVPAFVAWVRAGVRRRAA